MKKKLLCILIMTQMIIASLFIFNTSSADSLDAPGETIPLITLDDSKIKDVTFETSGQSMWKDGIPPGSITYDMTPEITISGFKNSATSQLFSAIDALGIPGWAVGLIDVLVDALTKTFTGSLLIDTDLGVQFKGKIKDYDGGTINVTYPENIKIEFPLANTFWSNDLIRLSPTTIDLTGKNLKTYPPDINFTLLTDFSLKETFEGSFAGLTIVSKEIIDISEDDVELFSVDESHGPYDFSIIDDSTGYVPEGYIEMPSVDISSGTFEVTGKHQFSDLFVDMDQYYGIKISDKKGTPKLPLHWKSENIGGFSFEYTILEADLNHGTWMNQELKFTPTTYIRYIFSDPVEYKGSMVTEIITESDLENEVKLPTDRIDPITVTPSVFIENEFCNKYYVNGTNIIDGEAGKLKATAPGIPLLPVKLGPFYDPLDWTECCETILGVKICLPCPEAHYFGPYTTPSFNMVVGPAITAFESHDNTTTLYDKTFEIGGFQEILLPTFELDPQVEPYPIPIPSGTLPYEVDEGSIIMLDGSESYDLDDDPIRLYWDLDNGTEFEDASEHEFEEEGMFPPYLGIEGPNIYTIRLMANDPYGYRINQTNILVNNVAPTPKIDEYIQPNPYFILPDVHELDFHGSLMDPGWHDTHTGTWDFGDGTIIEAIIDEENDYPQSTGTTETKHIYHAPGVYNVTLTITDDDGASSSIKTTITVITANEALDELKNYINELPDECIIYNPIKIKYLLSTEINKVQTMIDESKYFSAIEYLLYKFRPHFDGLINGLPLADGDMVICVYAQENIMQMIDDIVAYLAGISDWENRELYN